MKLRPHYGVEIYILFMLFNLILFICLSIYHCTYALLLLPVSASRWFHRANCRCRKFCRRIIKSQTFYWLVIVLVFLNTCTLTSEHNHQPQWLDRFQGTRTSLRFISHASPFDRRRSYAVLPAIIIN